MNRIALTFVLAMVSISISGQINLVPNPSFEILDTCPDAPGDLENAVPWFQPNNPQIYSYGSTDFFHACDTEYVSTPSNIIGFQVPRTGSGYGGFAAYNSLFDNYGHEYLETELTNPMDSGRLYCVSFYVVLSNVNSICGTSAIGTYISVDTCQYGSSVYYVMNVQPQVVNDSNNIITDTVNWNVVAGTYRSHGLESFITIGNFWDVAYNSTNNDPNCSGIPYYFIDDVSVVCLPILNAGHDSSIVVGDTLTMSGTISDNWTGMQFEWLPHTGLDDPYSLNSLAYPDSTITYVLTVSCSTCEVPCLSEVFDSVTVSVQAVEPPLSIPFHIATLFTTEQSFVIDSLPSNTRLSIYDARGRLIYFSDNYNNDFVLAGLASAIYTYEIVLADTRQFKGKFGVFQR